MGGIVAHLCELCFVFLYVCLCFVWGRRTRTKMELPNRGEGTCNPTMPVHVREGRSSPPWLHFWLHFRATLGTKFATILLFCRPGRQNGPQKADQKMFRLPGGIPISGATHAGGPGLPDTRARARIVHNIEYTEHSNYGKH